MSVISLQNGNGSGSIHYEFDPSQKPLGEGGMGRVFRGIQIDESDGSNRVREVAIKLLFDDLPDHAIKRARREASVRIKNDNLVEMIDFVEDRDSNGHSVHYHVVSEFLNGVNLDELLEGKTLNHDGSHNPTADRLLYAYNNNKKAFAGEVFRSILSGIMALHDAGYIHRDIDPSNIMVTSEGKIKLIDFGIAKKFNELGTVDKQLTSTGQFVGKTHYAAPELLLGDLNNQNRTTDIYSLGITLYQLMTGHLPFDGPFQEVHDKQLHEKLPLKDIQDKTVRRIIEKATEKDQKKRYQSASEFRVDIDRWMASGNDDDNRRFTLDISIPKSILIYKKIALVAASIAVIGVSSYYIVKAIHDRPKPPITMGGNNQEESFGSIQPEKEYENTKKSPNKERNADYAQKLIKAGGASAQDGIRILDSLAKNNDYEAASLLSSLYFDCQKNSKGLEFYKENSSTWEAMRMNCTITPNNKMAHNYRMQAYQMKKAQTDYVLLYEIGCDFFYGRGVEQSNESAEQYFMKVKELMEKDPQAKQYAEAINIDGKLDAIKERKNKNNN